MISVQTFQRAGRAAATSLAALVMAAIATVACAHHSGAMFDDTREVTYEGKVVEFKWGNPHVFVILDVPTKGTVKRYSLEGPAPSTMKRDGWTFKSLKAGDQVRVTAHPIRDGRPVGQLLDVTFPDGRKVTTVPHLAGE